MQLRRDRRFHSRRGVGASPGEPGGGRLQVAAPLCLLARRGRDCGVEVFGGVELDLETLALEHRGLDRTAVLALDGL